jgi:phosphomannomutase
MKIDPSIFKSYDIRGVYPETINEETVKQIGQAFVNLFNLKKVVIGVDGRNSGPALEKALVEGITIGGADVVRAGICSTDMVYFASGFYPDIDAGAMITASHNPKEYNGLKLILKGAKAVSGEEGLLEIRDKILKEDLIKGSRGKEENRDIYNDYAEKILSIIEPEKIKPLKVAIDAGNGVAGFVVEKLFKNLSVEIVPIYFDIDGNFPNHQPSPIEEKNIEDLKKKVLESKADLGLAFDGDGDRVFLVDENGQAVSATIMTAMIAKRMLQAQPGARILYNLICGKIVPETIEANKGVPSITKVGHSLIKAQMRKEDGLFAGEHSGHYFFKDLYYADSGMLASLVVLELISSKNKPLSVIADEFNKYYLSGEINTEVADQEGKIKEIKEKFSDAKISELDGVSVEYQNWWFNVRPSNTEPLLRLNVEADSQDLMEKKRDQLLEIIRA